MYSGWHQNIIWTVSRYTFKDNILRYIYIFIYRKKGKIVPRYRKSDRVYVTITIFVLPLNSTVKFFCIYNFRGRFIYNPRHHHPTEEIPSSQYEHLQCRNAQQKYLQPTLDTKTEKETFYLPKSNWVLKRTWSNPAPQQCCYLFYPRRNRRGQDGAPKEKGVQKRCGRLLTKVHTKNPWC